ncbi:reverse transcriptase family protein [Patulibacter minatonensis]|uniref:reverse transcriptase family protein n=1 Tax=Patulibacter minatonensis TaxID=298163 RepID=UPI000683E9C7|nr:reverse transcriptase family protein [Patulibacter minatonensis]
MRRGPAPLGTPPGDLAQAAAAALLAGAWTERAMLRRLQQAVRPLGPRLPARLVASVLALHRTPPADAPRALAQEIDDLVRGHAPRGGWPPNARVRRRYAPPTAMRGARWPVAPLPTVAALGRLVGERDPGALAWLADVRGLEREVPDERLRAYRYTHHPRTGGPPRVLERPKARLKEVQRTLLREVLAPIPPHDAACGFVAGRSVLDHAARHVGRTVVVQLDLEDFFAQVTAGRVFGILRAAGYPEPVAHAIVGLTTNVVPYGFWARIPRPDGPREIERHHRLGRRLATPHLPQGAPTSPALANLAAFRLDRRLDGLARSLGLTYSRYADDLALSGGRHLARRAYELERTIAAIAADEGFRVNPQKTRVRAREGRQTVCGIVVNERPAVARRDVDRLRALLHEAEVAGPRAADRGGMGPAFEAHVRGRVAWVAQVHPARGARLREQLRRVDWSALRDTGDAGVHRSSPPGDRPFTS